MAQTCDLSSLVISTYCGVKSLLYHIVRNVFCLMHRTPELMTFHDLFYSSTHILPSKEKGETFTNVLPAVVAHAHNALSLQFFIHAPSISAGVNLPLHAPLVVHS